MSEHNIEQNIVSEHNTEHNNLSVVLNIEQNSGYKNTHKTKHRTQHRTKHRTKHPTLNKTCRKKSRTKQESNKISNIEHCFSNIEHRSLPSLLKIHGGDWNFCKTCIFEHLRKLKLLDCCGASPMHAPHKSNFALAMPRNIGPS
jgi:hypothetical protein